MQVKDFAVVLVEEDIMVDLVEAQMIDLDR